jgi:small nuclear ribonucleoprotein (snRNP)-like protein
MIGSHFIGKRVVVRTRTAGVHFGTLIERDKEECLLSNARRVWSWEGALSLSEVSSIGIKLKESKISVAVDNIILTDAIEYIPISKESNLPS